PPSQGRGDRQGRRDDEARAGRPGDPRPGSRDRCDQDGRPVRQRHRGRRPDDRGDGPEHGDRGGFLMAHGKKYLEAAKLVDPLKAYGPDEAARLAKDTTTVAFDATLEAHIRLGVDPRHADQMVRGTVVLPSGTGKQVRVAVFAQGEKAQEALRAGADEVGAED